MITEELIKIANEMDKRRLAEQAGQSQSLQAARAGSRAKISRVAKNINGLGKQY